MEEEKDFIFEKPQSKFEVKSKSLQKDRKGFIASPTSIISEASSVS